MLFAGPVLLQTVFKFFLIERTLNPFLASLISPDLAICGQIYVVTIW